MATTQVPREKRVETRDRTVEPSREHKPLGIDAEGYVHHYDPFRQQVWRFDFHGEIERITDLGAYTVSTYVGFVGAEIGWTDRWLIPSYELFGGVW